MTARDISQSELARAAVLQKSQLSRYFSGTRMLTVPSMARICLYLRIPIGVIFEEITEQQRPAIRWDFEGYLVPRRSAQGRQPPLKPGQK